MEKKFLESLPISEEERQKLVGLGASTPLAVLFLRKASPEAFDRHIGEDRAPAIAEALEGLLNDEEKARLKAPFSPKGKFGARLGPGANKPESGEDLAERARLLKELRSLKRKNRTTQRERRISEIEAELSTFISRR
jgi:hypothetical protein